MEYIDIIVKLVGLFTIVIGIYQYKKKRELEALEMFIKYREKLKTNESMIKIITHIQECESNQELSSQITEKGITKYDFYFFLGYYEEIAILYKSNLMKKQIAKDMFAYYAIKVAYNDFYWKVFEEDFWTDDNWLNFRSFIIEMSDISWCEKMKKKNEGIINSTLSGRHGPAMSEC